MSEADRWNKAHPQGTRVMLRDDFLSTSTRSLAWMSNGEALVYVDSLAGAYPLKYLTAIEEDEDDER